MVAFLLSSLIGTAVLGAALLKLAAFLFKRTQLRWKPAVVSGLVAGAVGLVFGTLADTVPQPLVAASVYAAAVGVHVWFAGWFLGSRANRPNAEPLGFKGGGCPGHHRHGSNVRHRHSHLQCATSSTLAHWRLTPRAT